MYCLTSYASPIGLLTLGSDGKHLTGLWIQGQKYFGGENVGEIGKEQGPEPAVFGDARKWLDRYFSGQKPCPDELPLVPEGTEFQKLIWGLLCEIPYGTVTTYGALAKKAAARMGRDTMSGQAVGGALFPVTVWWGQEEALQDMPAVWTGRSGCWTMKAWTFPGFRFRRRGRRFKRGIPWSGRMEK